MVTGQNGLSECQKGVYHTGIKLLNNPSTVIKKLKGIYLPTVTLYDVSVKISDIIKHAGKNGDIPQFTFCSDNKWISTMHLYMKQILY